MVIKVRTVLTAAAGVWVGTMLVVAGPRLMGEDWLARQMQQHLAQSAGGLSPVISGGIRLQMLPRPAVSAESVLLRNERGERIAETGPVDVSLALLPLLRGQLVPASLTIRDLRLSLDAPRPDKGGASSAAAASVPETGGAGGTGSGTGPGPLPARHLFSPAQLVPVTLTNAEIDLPFAYGGSGGNSRITGLNGALTVGPDGLVRLAVSGQAGDMPVAATLRMQRSPAAASSAASAAAGDASQPLASGGTDWEILGSLLSGPQGYLQLSVHYDARSGLLQDGVLAFDHLRPGGLLAGEGPLSGRGTLASLPDGGIGVPLRLQMGDETLEAQLRLGHGGNGLEALLRTDGLTLAGQAFGASRLDVAFSRGGWIINHFETVLPNGAALDLFGETVTDPAADPLSPGAGGASAAGKRHFEGSFDLRSPVSERGEPGGRLEGKLFLSAQGELRLDETVLRHPRLASGRADIGLTASLEGGAAPVIRFDSLSWSSGTTQISGEGRLMLALRPQLELDLRSSGLRLDDVLPLSAPPQLAVRAPVASRPLSAGAASAGVNEPPLPVAAPRPAITVTSLPPPAVPGTVTGKEKSPAPGLSGAVLGLISGVEGRIGLDLKNISLRNSKLLDEASATLTLLDGRLSLSQGKGQSNGGSLQYSGTLQADGQMNAAVQMVGVNPHDWLAGLRVIDATTLDANLQVSGSVIPAQADQPLWTGLRGEGDWSLENGKIRGVDLATINKALSDRAGLAGLAVLLRTGLTGGETAFSGLSGSLRLENGKLISEDIALEASGAKAQGSVTVSWASNTGARIDGKAAFRLDALPAGPPVSWLVRGPLTAPEIALDLGGLQGWLKEQGAKALTGAAGAAAAGVAGAAGGGAAKGGSLTLPANSEQAQQMFQSVSPSQLQQMMKAATPENIKTAKDLAKNPQVRDSVRSILRNSGH